MLASYFILQKCDPSLNPRKEKRTGLSDANTAVSRALGMRGDHLPLAVLSCMHFATFIWCCMLCCKKPKFPQWPGAPRDQMNTKQTVMALERCWKPRVQVSSSFIDHFMLRLPPFKNEHNTTICTGLYWRRNQISHGKPF